MGREARVKRLRHLKNGTKHYGNAEKLIEQDKLHKSVERLGLVVPELDVPKLLGPDGRPLPNLGDW